MVATVNLGCKLELKQIALKARNSEYNPKASLLCFLATASLLRPSCACKPLILLVAAICTCVETAYMSLNYQFVVYSDSQL